MIPTSRGLLLLASVALAACNQASREPPVANDEVYAAAVSGTANTAVTWSVQEASGGTISSSGLYSAPSTPGTYHVVAACQADPSISAVVTVTVAAPPPSSFAVSPTSATVAVGGTQQFAVVPDQAVTWSIVKTPVKTTPVYPLRVSSSGRYLVDMLGQPWRIQADAAWGMATKATPAEVDTYLATRKAQGFNAFYLWPIAHAGAYPTLPNAPNNYAGAPPFTGALWTTPNEAYWAWIDTIIDKAAAHGIVVMFAFEYLGYPNTAQGWWSEVGARSAADSTTWGTWLGNRYKNRPNIIWFALGDQTPAAGSTLEARHLAAINAIKAAGATQPWMAEPMGGNSNPVMDAPDFASVLDLNSFYGYGNTGRGDCYPQADRAYRNTPARPVWVQEGGYEYENNTGGFPPGSYHTRRTRFWSVLAGGTAGDGFGSRDVYQWVNFPASLSTPGATFSQHAFDLFASIPWWKLQPSGSGTGFAGKTLITAGGGTWGGMDFVASAVTSDGGYLIAYVPTTGGTNAISFSVDMSALAGPVRATWWDPTTGSSTLIGSGLANSGTRSFTTPGVNGGGQNDWVLLLDAAGTELCGTISPSGLYAAPVTVPTGVTCQVMATSQANGGNTAAAQVIVQ